MSYDIGLYINTGIEETEVMDIGNYTYNCSGMFRKALPAEYGGINGLSGKVAGDEIPALRIAVRDMEEQPEVYSAMNPPNGWGNYEGALQFLKDILAACKTHPATIIRVH